MPVAMTLWGYLRAYFDARNDVRRVNHKKIRCFWAEEGLLEVVKRRRKRIGVSAVPAVAADKAGNEGLIGFQFVSTITDTPIKILSIVDEHTREFLGGIVRVWDEEYKIIRPHLSLRYSTPRLDLSTWSSRKPSQFDLTWWLER